MFLPDNGIFRIKLKRISVLITSSLREIKVILTKRVTLSSSVEAKI